MTKDNIILHHTIGWFQLAAAVLLSLTTGSCTTDETSGFKDDQPVIVSAYVTESALTRATTYDDHGSIKSGTYYLCYPTSNAGTKTAEVVFKDGYGEAIVMRNQGKLTWKQIGDGNSDRTLGLTNVSPEKHDKYDGSTFYNNPIIFKDDEKQFLAGRYIPYGEENTNDILLASKSPYRPGTPQDHLSNYVHFELHHCMARVRVIVETRPNDASFDPLEGLLENAKVDITNVVLKPYSFIPYIGDKTTFTNVVAIYPKDGTLDGCKFNDINLLNTLDDDADKEWANMGNALDDDKKVVGQAFTTYDILLPPQQLRTDNDRPRLVITVQDDSKPNGVKTYSGILPHIMFDEQDNQLSLEFLAEHLLTIRTVISNDPPELIFMPVKVVEWVDKGEYDLTAQQAGIYNEADFKDMMKYYNEYNASKLLQYGYRKDNKWVFNIFRNLVFNNDEIEGQMPVKKEEDRDYSFDFNTWFTVKVDSKECTPEEFKALLSGNNMQ